MDLPPAALLGGHLATRLRDVTRDVSALDSQGWWAVVTTFENETVCARFDDVRPVRSTPTGRWRGPAVDAWTSSMDRDAYVRGVERVRAHIAAGDVYQANVCRVLSAPLPDPERADVIALAYRLAVRNPAPHVGAVRLPDHGLAVATASPELFLRHERTPAGVVVTSRPIKGTGRTAADIGDKDRAENVMIVDLVRNDLGIVCATGSVTVPELCAYEEHPGLVHLVSTVEGVLRPDVGWPELFAATFPPGSVTGAPKQRALELLREIEPVQRGPYCGAVGWVDADRGVGELAVAIRTFWVEQGVDAGEGGGTVCFGTGAGITWASDAAREWDETELKARHLLEVVAGDEAQ
jgi:para-aminobenzoate synthetase component 1